MNNQYIYSGKVDLNTLLLEIATRNILSLLKTDTIGKSAQLMAAKKISSIVITDVNAHPVGIVTERNILQAMRTGCSPDTPVEHIMSFPVITVPETIKCLDAYQICLNEGIRHLVIVDANNMLLGIVSETDFRSHVNLAALAGSRTISTVMSHSAFTLTPDASLNEALDMMQSHNDSCVVIVENNRPVGIITERDVVKKYAENFDNTFISVKAVMKSPVQTVSVDTTISQGAERMLAAQVRQLVVVGNDGRLAGLLDEHDLTRAMTMGLIDDKLITDGLILSTLVNSIPDLIWLKDTDGLYVACNKRFENFFGASEKHIIGKTDYDFVDKQLADHFREHDQIALDNDQPSINEEWVTFAEDGHQELLETIKSRMYDKLGNVIGILGIARNITERKSTESELRLLATAFESHEGMMITDAQNTILRVNQAFTAITVLKCM